MKILMQFIRISVKRILAYPNEIYMVFLQAFVSVVSTALFWAVLFSGVEAYGHSQESEVALSDIYRKLHIIPYLHSVRESEASLLI